MRFGIKHVLFVTLLFACVFAPAPNSLGWMLFWAFVVSVSFRSIGYSFESAVISGCLLTLVLCWRLFGHNFLEPFVALGIAFFPALAGAAVGELIRWFGGQTSDSTKL